MLVELIPFFEVSDTEIVFSSHAPKVWTLNRVMHHFNMGGKAIYGSREAPNIVTAF
jgi:hypothetical protein